MILPRNLPSLITLLECCSTTTNLQSLHATAIKISFSRHEIVRSKLVSAYAISGDMISAHLAFSFCNRKPTFLYNSLIRAHFSLRQFTLSLSVFSHLLSAGTPLDSNTIPAVLRSVAGLSALSLGRGVHVKVVVNGFGSDLGNCNGLITMYAKCGDLESARKVFDEIPERSVVSWTALIGGYGMHGRFYEVCDLFEGMLEAGVSPDEAVFASVLTGCSHGGFVEKGREYFEMMRRRFGIRANKVHYTCMVDMFVRAGMIEEAKGIVERLDVDPDEVLWRALYGPFAG